MVRCAHKSGDVINLIIVACKISSRLKGYKNYKNPLRLAKVIVKNKMSRFLWFSVYIDTRHKSALSFNLRYIRRLKRRFHMQLLHAIISDSGRS